MHIYSYNVDRWLSSFADKIFFYPPPPPHTHTQNKIKNDKQTTTDVQMTVSLLIRKPPVLPRRHPPLRTFVSCPVRSRTALGVTVVHSEQQRQYMTHRCLRYGRQFSLDLCVGVCGCQRGKDSGEKRNTNPVPSLQLSKFDSVLLYVHRNRRLIRDGSPGRPPPLSHSSSALSEFQRPTVLNRTPPPPPPPHVPHTPLSSVLVEKLL